MNREAEDRVFRTAPELAQTLVTEEPAAAGTPAPAASSPAPGAR